jgi:hypothetical protein
MLAAMLLAYSVAAQETFEARLATVPIDAFTSADVTGSGAAEARLEGNALVVSGSFAGLRGPATDARLHGSVVTGVRGPALFDLQVSKATSGTVSGRVELTAGQLEDLRNGRLYIQIHSERAPDGNLWGWLLP